MSNNNSEMTHETKVQKLKRQRIRQMITSALGIGVLLWGVVKVTMLFLDYKKTETCNDAQVEQYLAPVNVRAIGYIKKVYFTEHKRVQKGGAVVTDASRTYLDLSTEEE